MIFYEKDITLEAFCSFALKFETGAFFHFSHVENLIGSICHKDGDNSSLPSTVVTFSVKLESSLVHLLVLVVSNYI